MLKFEAVGLFVDNMETMVTFYRDVIGLDIHWDGGGYTSCKIAGGISFSLCERKILQSGIITPLAYPNGVNGTVELCFGAASYSDVDREFARLTAAGAKPVDKPSTAPWGQRCCFVADPEGNLIEIWSSNDDTTKTL